MCLCCSQEKNYVKFLNLCLLAGDGAITRLLLEMTPSTVVTWEPREAFYKHLQVLPHAALCNFILYLGIEYMWINE